MPPTNKQPCGCYFGPGHRITYSELRAHFDHVKIALDNAASALLMLELVVDINHDMDVCLPISEARMAVMDATVKWEEQARRGLDRKYPANALAEALGL